MHLYCSFVVYLNLLYIFLKKFSATFRVLNVGLFLFPHLTPCQPCILFLFCREWDFDLKKLPNIKMRKMCANDAVPKKRKKETSTAVDRDLGELELNDDPSDSDEEMTAVA